MKTRTALAVLAALTIPVLLGPRASGQCSDWRAGPLNGVVGTSSEVYASTLWDPDGAGPAGNQLVVGGPFYSAGGIVCYGLARWDGTAWQSFGSPFTSGQFHGYPLALSVYPGGMTNAGQLLATGFLDHAGGSTVNNIARFDGSAWHALGTGLDDAGRAFAFWDPDGSGPQLVVGGSFTTAGGVTANGIARFDGTSWQPLGSGVSYANPSAHQIAASVWSLAVWDPDGPGPLPPVLIAGGFFDHAGGVPARGIAMWDGSQWHSLAGGVDGDPTTLGEDPSVIALTTWDPDGAGPQNPVLVAGGYFDTAGGVTVNGIARWNGTAWSGFSTGMNDEVEALTVFNGQLIAGGDFTTAGGNAAVSAARWTGSGWAPLGAGLDADVFTLMSWLPPGAANPQLFAGGTFFQSGSLDVNCVTSWNGSNWLQFAPPAFSVTINAMAQLGSTMVGAGQFHVSTQTTLSPNNIATWDGRFVAGLGTGTDGVVNALKSFNTGIGVAQQQHLLAGGSFANADGVPASRIAQWNQSADIAGAGWTALGAGFNNTVRAIERFNNVTCAAGDFTASGATSLSHIASWNGTSWQPLGPAATQGLDGDVSALKTYNGSLYAGGTFTHAASGTITTGGLARWDGTVWHLVGGNFIGSVFALEVYNSQLVIGGTFSGINSSPNLAQYNSVTNTYSTFSTGGTDGAVRSACVGADGNLYIGGDFTTVGGVSAGHIGRWNGSAWSAAGGGADGAVNALCPFHNEITVGGAFTNVRGGTILSPGWARFSTEGVPWVQEQPFPAGPVCAGAEVSFSCRAAEGYSASYQWRHNGVPLTMGVQSSGTVLGTDGAVLDVVNTHATDTGLYDCVISNACGSSATTTASLVVNSADFNGDGDIGTDADIEAFFACLAGSCCPTCGSADFNADGDIGTDADIEAFFRVLAGGSC